MFGSGPVRYKPEAENFNDFIMEHFPDLYTKRISKIFEISGYPFEIRTGYSARDRGFVTGIRPHSITPQTYRLVRAWMGIHKPEIMDRILFEKL